MHLEVTYTRRNGLCPVLLADARVQPRRPAPGHGVRPLVRRNRARAEETWLIAACNQRLNDTEFKAGVRSAFESYQIALRGLLQTRQTTLTDRRDALAS